MTLDEFLANAKKSVLFTSPDMEKDLSAFLSEQTARIKALAEQALSSGLKQLYWVGSGNSWCSI